MALYYESHVTLDPVFGDRLDVLREACSAHGFRVAKLLMKKRGTDAGVPSDLDSFCTGTSRDLDGLRDTMQALILALKAGGFVVRRYKIETIVLDSRVDDELHLL